MPPTQTPEMVYWRLGATMITKPWERETIRTVAAAEVIEGGSRLVVEAQRTYTGITVLALYPLGAQGGRSRGTSSPATPDNWRAATEDLIVEYAGAARLVYSWGGDDPWGGAVEEPLPHPLTPRQREDVRLLARGFSPEAIANQRKTDVKRVYDVLRRACAAIGVDARDPDRRAKLLSWAEANRGLLAVPWWRRTLDPAVRARGGREGSRPRRAGR